MVIKQVRHHVDVPLRASWSAFCLVATQHADVNIFLLSALQSPGKLVRQLVQDGEHVVEGQAFAEIEVMKMIQTLASPAAGVISFSVSNHA